MKPSYILFIVASIFIAYFAYLTRNHLYNQLPFPGESTDEYSNSWVGLSLIRLGLPVGISGLANAYPQTYHHYLNVDRILQSTANGTPAAINYPWFDHPPAVGLITGGFAFLKGARVFEDTSISLIRKPLVYLGVITTLLVFVFATLVFGPTTGLFAGVIYSLSPYIAITSRLVQAENFLVPLFLTTLICLYQFCRTSKEAYLWLAAIVAGLSLLFKLSGVGIILTGIVLLLSRHHSSPRDNLLSAFVFGFVSISFLAFFLVFGFSFDPGLFLQVFTGNINRTYGIGPNAIAQLFSTGKVTNIRYFTDGWYLSGWFSFFTLFLSRRKSSLFLVVPTLCYLITYLVFGSYAYGWYSFPFLPFIVIALSRLLALSLKHLKLLPFAVLALLIPIGVNLNQLYQGSAFTPFVPVWRLGLPLVLLLSLLPFSRFLPKQHLVSISRTLVLLLFLLALYIGYRYFIFLTIDTWYHVT